MGAGAEPDSRERQRVRHPPGQVFTRVIYAKLIAETRGRRSVDQVQLSGAADGRRKAVDVELPVDRPELRMDRVERHEQARRGLTLRGARREHLEDLDLAP